MSEISRLRVGIDLAKTVFQVHGVREVPGEPVVMMKRLARSQMEPFLAKLPPSLIGMEACGSAHYWARIAQKHGHEVHLIPPAHVKPYVRRNKTDANDAAAICEALSRPTMRFVPVKSEADQATLMLHRVRASFVEKRTAAANQLRAMLAEFGVVMPVGERGLSHLLKLVETRGDAFECLPQSLRLVLEQLALQWRHVDSAVRTMDVEIAASLKTNARARRLRDVPVIGPIGASAIDALLPNPKVFKSGRDFAAWIGLTPREDSSGNTIRRGSITKKGDGYLRRILVLGATAYLARVRRGAVKGASEWEQRMAAHPKRKLAAVALANKTARIAWAMLAKDQDYRAPALVAAA
jgi:transposase